MPFKLFLGRNHHTEFGINSVNVNYWCAMKLSYYTRSSVKDHVLLAPGRINCLERSAAIKAAIDVYRVIFQFSMYPTGSHWERHANRGKSDTLLEDREPQNPTLSHGTYPYSSYKGVIPQPTTTPSPRSAVSKLLLIRHGMLVGLVPDTDGVLS